MDNFYSQRLTQFLDNLVNKFCAIIGLQVLWWPFIIKEEIM